MIFNLSENQTLSWFPEPKIMSEFPKDKQGCFEYHQITYVPACSILVCQGRLTDSLLKVYLFFNWRIIALQNFVGFCQTSTWISHRYAQVNRKGSQSWIFFGRANAEAEAPILWPPDVKNWLLRKDPDAGKDWRHEEKGTTEDEMVGWHHRLNGLEFEEVPGVGDGQGSLACCRPWGCKELDTTEWLNWTEWDL